MNFEEQKQKIQEMINDGQKRVEDITSRYTNYIKENKQISEELEGLVKKLKECTGNLGKIGEAYERSKKESKQMEEEFVIKVQEREAESARKNKEQEEALRKQKEELEAAAATQKQELETKIQEQKRADDEALAQQKIENEEAINALKKQKADAEVLAAQQMEQAKTEAAQALETEKQAATERLSKAHELDEAQIVAVQQELEQFKTKAAQELEDLRKEAAAAKQTSENAHNELMEQQKTQNDELLKKQEEDHKSAIEQMKTEFEKARGELKSTLENTQLTALEEAKLKCQSEREDLVNQITAFQKSIKELTANQDEEVKISLQGFKDTVTETCTKIQEIQNKMPKEEATPPEVPVPQLKTEEIPVGPQPPPIPPQEKIDEMRAKSKDVAERERIWAEAIKKIETLTQMPNVDGGRMHPNWLFKDDRFAYEMCANKNLGPEQCGPEVIKAENDRVINTFAPFQDTKSRQNYEQHIKHAFIELVLSMKKQKIHYDKDLHEIRIWLRMWFVKYMIAFPIKQKKIPTVEEHKQWYASNLKHEVDPDKYKSLETGLAKLGHSIKHSPGSHRRRHRSRSRSKSPAKGGFRYGMKIPRRRTLRSKLKTQRLKSVKKNRKRKSKKSRKKRRRKKTAKNKK